MTGTFEVLNGNTKVNFEYTADTTKVQTVIGDCAHYLFDNQGIGRGQQPVDFDTLTNQEKLDLVDEHLRKEVIKIATVYARTAGETAGREAAEAAALVNYDLGS